MSPYDLHASEVNFQHVPVHHVLQELTRTFGGDLLIDAIKRFEERDQKIVTDPERLVKLGHEHVIQ